MMLAKLLRERPRLPPLHARGDYRHMVHSPALHRHIAADVRKALPPKKLTRARDVLDAYVTIVIAFAVLAKWRANETEFRILGHSAEQELEVLAVESNIGVEAGDEF